MRSQRIALGLLVAVAFGIRLFFFLGDPNPHQLAGLSATQGEIARNIDSHGKWFVFNLNVLTPGGEGENSESLLQKQEREHKLIDPSDLDYSRADAHPVYEPYVLHMQGVGMLLAAVWKITGDMDYGYLQVLQVVLASLVTLLVWWIALVLYGRPRTALLAAALYAVALPIAALVRLPFYDAWATIVVPVVVACFLKARMSEEVRARMWWLVGTGSATGFALYFRPPIAVMTLLLAVVLSFERGVRAALPFAVVPLAVAAVMLAPWTLRNAHEFHEFVPANTGTGQVLWQGLGEHDNDFGAYNDDNRTRAQVHAVRPDLRYDTPQYDSFLLDKATAAIRDHPGYYLGLVGDRLARGTVRAHWLSWSNHASHWEDDSPSGIGERLSWLWDKFQTAVGLFADPALILLALATVIATWRRRWREHVLVLAIPVALLFVPLILALEFRYVAPAGFAWMILAAYGVDVAAEKALA